LISGRKDIPMTKSDLPRPPAGTRAAGSRLWRAVLADYALEEHELALLREAVRTADVLDELDARVKVDGAIIDSPQGLKAHPAAVEARQQRITLARLLAALRVPLGDEDDRAGNARPQRRTGVRGVYGIRGAVS
jgi:hypothetical protein